MAYLTDPQSALMMGMEGMGVRNPRKSMRRRIAANNPYMSEDEKESVPGELEAYLSEKAIQEQLDKMQYSARSNALLQAGSAMLQAPDLMSGIGAAAGAFGQPLQEYQQAARQMPTEAALARYDIAGTEQQRGMAQAQEGRAQAGEARQQGQYDYSVERRPFEESIDDLAMQKGEAELRRLLAEEPYLAKQIESELAYRDSGTQQNISSSGKLDADTQETREMLPYQKRRSDAETYATEQQGNYYGAGAASGGPGGGRGANISPHSAVTDWRAVLNETDQMQKMGQLPWGDDAVNHGAALVLMREHLGYVDNPQDRAVYGQRLQLTEEALRKYAAGIPPVPGDTIHASIAAYFDWKATQASE